MPSKTAIIAFGVTATAVIVGLFVYNQWVSPMINKSKVTPPATA